jgi:zinc-ribbon domain
MAFCIKCGTQLAEGAKFCHSCGTPVGTAGGARAEPARSIHQTFAVNGTQRVSVRNEVPGSIEITQGAGDQITVDWDLKESGYLDWDASQNGDMITISCRARPGEIWPQIASMGASRANVLVKVPNATNLDLSCRFGEITVEGVKGVLYADTATGNLVFKNCEGVIDSRTHTGHIDFQNVNGKVSARDSAGSIHFLGSLSDGESMFRTKAGNVDLFLSGDPQVTIDASSKVGRVAIAPELKTSQLRSEQYTVGHRVFSVVGSGTNRLIAETYTGTISIQPAGPSGSAASSKA